MFPLIFCLVLFSFSNRFVFALYCFILFSSLSSIFCLIVIVIFVSHLSIFVFDIWSDFNFESIYVWVFVWFSLFIVFSVKYPLWPFHSWLPEVHVEASTEISCILASIVLKVGFFGLYKFLVVNVFLSVLFLSFIDFVVLFGLFLVSFILLFNVDYKNVIAFWSILHTGLCILLFWHNDFLFMSIVVFCNFGHILSSCFMFVMIGFVYDVYGLRVFSILSSFCFSIWLSLFTLLILFNVDFPFTFMFYVDLLLVVSILHISIMYLFCFFVLVFVVMISSFYVFICLSFFSYFWSNDFFSFDVSSDEVFSLVIVLIIVIQLFVVFGMFCV